MIVLLAESNAFANTLMLAGVALLAAVLLYNIRKRSRGQADRPDPRERLEHQKQTSGMRNDLREMMVELENVTRQFSSQLDARTRKLEKLIEEADRRIEALGQAGAGGRSPEPRPQPEPEPKSRSGAGSGDNGAGGAAGGEPASASDRAGDEAPPVDQPVEPTPVAKKVYQLADAGCDAAQIARELNEHIGKVELILALRQEESA